MSFLKIHVFESVTSTNETAKAFAQKGAQGGEVVIAKTQTAGRGRLNRQWVSEKGNLFCSVILRPEIEAKKATHFTFVAAVAVAECLQKYLKEGIELKWPNDVLVHRKKICGILLELETKADKVDFIILGIGINVNETKFPPGFLHPPTSLKLSTKKDIDLEIFQKEILESLFHWVQVYLKEGFSPIQKAWQKRSVVHGQTVEIEDHGQRICGKGMGINEDGALVIETDAKKRIPIYSGDLVCF